MRYLEHDGRVQTWSLEAHPVDHCNLRCASCCQLSPHSAEAFLDPDELERDVSALRSILAPSVFKLTGGEPLLHPRLADLARIARPIAPIVQITTNGLLLARAPDAVFEAVDRIKLSWYTSAPLPEASIDRIRARCEEHEVELEVRAVSSFQRLDPDELVRDQAWAMRAWSGCWIKMRCHLVHRGRFYTCSRPPHLAPYLSARGIELDHANDGVDLHAPDLASRLRSYLRRDEPLASCKSCLGNEGSWEPHAQLPIVR